MKIIRVKANDRELIAQIRAESRVYGEKDQEAENEKVTKKIGKRNHLEGLKLITDINPEGE
jgi:hypothetical protein